MRTLLGLTLGFLVLCGCGGIEQATEAYLLKSNGYECVAYPCPSVDAVPLERPEQIKPVTDVDMSRVSSSEEERMALMNHVFSPSGLRVEGYIEIVPNAGPGGDMRVFRVTRVLSE